MTRQFTTYIKEDECIGDSLVTLNSNFSALDVAIQSNAVSLRGLDKAFTRTVKALSADIIANTDSLSDEAEEQAAINADADAAAEDLESGLDDAAIELARINALVLENTGFRNKLINAQGLINQRRYVSGTNFITGDRYTLDRWKIVQINQALTFTRTRNVTTFAAPAGGIEQVIEGNNMESGYYVLNWSGNATARVNNVVRAKGVKFWLVGGRDCTVTFSNGTFALPQLEKSATIHKFEYRPIGIELDLCQRYYCKTYDLSVAPGTAELAGAIWAHTDEPTSPTIHNIGWSFPVSMRVRPECTAYSPETGAIDRVYIATAPKVDVIVGSIAKSTKRISYVNLASNLTPTQSRQFTVHYTADAEM
jgi:hypothetical protein